MIQLIISALVLNRPAIRTAPLNPKIHMFGNDSPIHAGLAPFATWTIDQIAYGGMDVRKHVSNEIAKGRAPGGRALDVGCGTGVCASALQQSKAFESVSGIDTSAAMIQVAERLHRGIDFSIKNGADIEPNSFDVILVAFLMHELPEDAQVDLLEATTSGLKEGGEIWIVDIARQYKPSWSMLFGEPYLLDYLESFEDTIQEFSHNVPCTVEKSDIIPKRVTRWRLIPK